MTVLAAQQGALRAVEPGHVDATEEISPEAWRIGGSRGCSSPSICQSSKAHDCEELPARNGKVDARKRAHHGAALAIDLRQAVKGYYRHYVITRHHLPSMSSETQ